MDLHKVDGASCPPFLLLKSQISADFDKPRLQLLFLRRFAAATLCFCITDLCLFSLLASPFLLTFSQKKGYACQENSHLPQDG